MKSTLLISDELYGFLARESKEKYGSARKISALLNEILRKYFSGRNDLYGSTKKFSLKGLRDERDRFD